MSYEFRPCELEMDFTAYIKFLIQHQAELNLPYSFAMKLSFIASPLIFGKAMLVFSEEPYQIVGAAGFVYGTGAEEYNDRHVCQVEVAFLKSEHRRTTLFMRSLQKLVELIKAGEPAVQQLQFWAPADDADLNKLLSNFLAWSGSTSNVTNNMAFYTIPFRELESYCRRYRSE